MDKFLIEKSGPLKGSVQVSGAKNAGLPLMAACLLTDSELVLDNLPDLVDVRTMAAVLENLGVEIFRERDRITLDASKAEGYTAPYELVSTMRASYYVLGPLVARRGIARVSLPGGCAIGNRPIDIHLKGLEALGATVTTHGGYITCKADKLTGTRVKVSSQHGPSVGATMNIMLAASLARGESELIEAAREPEIIDLASMLRIMGVTVEGAGTSTIRIQGAESLGGGSYAVIPDRIEAGTLAVAAAISGGDILIQRCRPDHLGVVLDTLEQAGVSVERYPDNVRVRGNGAIKPFEFDTRPYPGFPTDMQAQFCALACFAAGESSITENIFENRFMHVPELGRMGANIAIDGRRAVVNGPRKLEGAPVMASDLRASAALVLAAIAAEGTSEINRIYHLDRGYDHLEIKLGRLGARILRVSE